MTLPLFLAAAAETDIAFALEWYNAEAPGLGVSFLGHVEEAFNRVRQYPAMYPMLLGSVRRALLHRFPYSVLYRIQPQAIEVIGVLPCRADPALVAARASATGSLQ